MRVLSIVEGTSVDGPGLRTSIYLAGCDHHCPGCHNPQSWDPQGGEEMSLDALMDVIAYNEPEQVAQLTARIKDELGYNIWLYTGFTWEQIVATPRLLAALEHIDVVVDGPFILAQRDTSLHFRGSANQRIIDVQQSLATGKVSTITL